MMVEPNKMSTFDHVLSKIQFQDMVQLQNYITTSRRQARPFFGITNARCKHAQALCSSEEQSYGPKKLSYIQTTSLPQENVSENTRYTASSPTYKVWSWNTLQLPPTNSSYQQACEWLGAQYHRYLHVHMNVKDSALELMQLSWIRFMIPHSHALSSSVLTLELICGAACKSNHSRTHALLINASHVWNAWANTSSHPTCHTW